jgi:hypothetical protein
MKYQIGDLLKVKCNNEYAYCVITSCYNETAKVFWIIEKYYIKNVPAYVSWSFSILDTEFERLLS